MDPKFYKQDIQEFPDDKAIQIAFGIDFACSIDKEDPDAAFESVSDFDFDETAFDDFVAEYIATESISTPWGKLINYEKEIKMAGNAMAKAAGAGINLLPGTDGFTTSAPRKKDGQYYTRATLAFSDGQAVRILFYNPDKPGEKHTYPTNVVSFQIFLNKKDITSHLVKGGGKDYGPMKFGKIIGNLLKKNSEKFQKKNAEIRAQKEEMEKIDEEMSGLDEQIVTKSNKFKQSQEEGIFLTKQHENWKEKADAATVKKDTEAKKQKKIEESTTKTEAGKRWQDGQYSKFLGKKFDRKLTLKEIAVLIRNDLKEAQSSGKILDAGARTYSVRIDENSISIHLKALPEDVELYSDSWKEYLRSGDQEIPRAEKRYCKSVKETLEKVESIANQYQKSTSDSMTDYFDYNYYLFVQVDGELNQAESEKVKSEVQTDNQVETGHDRDELKRILIAEYNQLRSDSDTPDFIMGISVGKKKNNKAGKVTLNLKKAEVSNLEELDELKEKIENIVKAHTDNYEILTSKAEKLIQKDIETKMFDPDRMPKISEKLYYKGDMANEEDIRTIIDIKTDKFSTKLVLKSDKTGKQSNIPLELLRRGATEKNLTDGNHSPFLFLDEYEELKKKEYEKYAQKPDPSPKQQEQVENTEVKQTGIPSEEAPKNRLEVNKEYKDSNGITKLITHEIESKFVSAVEKKGYIHSAYLKNNRWRGLPVEEKTIISEADLKKAIDRSKEAYQITDDILRGKYDNQGHEKVDQLIDEIADVIEEDSKLMQLANYYTGLLSKELTVKQETATA